MKVPWEPKSREEAEATLLRMRVALVHNLYFSWRICITLVGATITVAGLYWWDAKGVDAAGVVVAIGLAIALVPRSDHISEVFMRIPLTQEHLNEFESRLKVLPDTNKE